VRQEIWQRLEELRRQSGVTILLSTHYMEEAEKLCERLLVIDRGHIIATGSPREMVQSRVSSYALEVRDADSLPLQDRAPGVAAFNRNGAHLYFAAAPELLVPLMKHYEGRRVSVRASNLEDVFLQLVGSGEDEPEEADHQ
jgi:lipooligosaccharide transport system ATP-binding protein